jgi:hypothetical protein
MRVAEDNRETISGAATPQTAGVCTGLAELPRDAHLDAEALAHMLGCCKKSVQRAWRRGELPPPVTFMGRHVWLVGTILDHFQARQDAALREARKRGEKISQLAV